MILRISARMPWEVSASAQTEKNCIIQLNTLEDGKKVPVAQTRNGDKIKGFNKEPKLWSASYI